MVTRRVEQACQLYCQANKLSPGSGSVGVQKFEELARQLAEDPSAPAYIKAKERATRIRKTQ